MSTKEVGVHLHISDKTVETHRANVYKKLGVGTTAELTKYAVREGLSSIGG